MMPADCPLSFESPESSTIEGAHYDPTTLTLTVNFKRQEKERTAAVYIFPDVPPQEWDDFLAAPSKGSFFARRIRPIYSPGTVKK